MSLIRQFVPHDLFKFNNVNLDPLTENYGFGFYIHYISQWPDQFRAIESIAGRLVGYVMAKVEGIDKDWHGHITALSVAPEFRRQGMSKKLMSEAKAICERKACNFIDLFVRVTNEHAIALYEKLGYTISRKIENYYMDALDDQNTDAFVMIKSLNSRSASKLNKQIISADPNLLDKRIKNNSSAYR